MSISKSRATVRILTILSELDTTELWKCNKSLLTAGKWLKDQELIQWCNSEVAGGGYKKLKFIEEKIQYFEDNNMGNDGVYSLGSLENTIKIISLNFYKMLTLSYVKYTFIDNQVIETMSIIEADLVKMLLEAFKSRQENWSAAISDYRDFIVGLRQNYTIENKSISFMKHLWKYIDGNPKGLHVAFVKPYLEETYPLNLIDITHNRILIKSPIDERSLPQLLSSPQSVESIHFENQDGSPEIRTGENLLVLNEFLKERKNIWICHIKKEDYEYLPDIENISFSEFTDDCHQILSKIKSVKRLRLGKMKWGDLTPILEYKDTLIDLGFEGDITKSSEDIISQLINLESFCTTSSKFKSLGFLRDLPITYLYIYGSRITDFDDLRYLKDLRHFYLKTNKNWENFDFIEHLNNIEKIEIYFCSGIKKFPKCDHLKKLKKVSLVQCNKLIDVSELQKLTDCSVSAGGNALTKAGIEVHVQREEHLSPVSSSIKEGAITPLMIASESDSWQTFKLLVDAEMDINAINKDGMTALMCAATNSFRDSFSTLELLVDAGADITVISKNDGFTALDYGASNNHEGVVKLLVDAGAEVNRVQGVSGRTPLFDACSNRNPIMVKTLIDGGAIVNVGDKRGTTPLMMATGPGKKLKDKMACIKCLIEAGADVNMTDKERGTAIAKESNGGNYKVVQYLIDRGAHINIQNTGSGYTPLISAAGSKSDKIVEILIKEGADVSLKTHTGWTALIAAIYLGAQTKKVINIVNLLISNGVDVNSRYREMGTSLNFTALDLALSKKGKYDQVVEILKKAEAVRAITT